MRKLSREVRLLLALLLLLSVWTGAFLLRCSPATPAGACRRTAFLMFHPVRALFLEAAPAEGGIASDFAIAPHYAEARAAGAALYEASGWVPRGADGVSMALWLVTQQPNGRYTAELIGGGLK